MEFNTDSLISKALASYYKILLNLKIKKMAWSIFLNKKKLVNYKLFSVDWSHHYHTEGFKGCPYLGPNYSQKLQSFRQLFAVIFQVCCCI